VPVHDTAHEGAYERRPRVRARGRLDEGEDEGEVARYALGLQDPASLDALPCGRNLDEDTRLGDAELLVDGDQGPGLGNRGVGVEGEAGIDLGGDVAGDEL